MSDKRIILVGPVAEVILKLESDNAVLTAEVERLRAELDAAQAACFDMKEMLVSTAIVYHRNKGEHLHPGNFKDCWNTICKSARDAPNPGSAITARIVAADELARSTQLLAGYIYAANDLFNTALEHLQPWKLVRTTEEALATYNKAKEAR